MLSHDFAINNNFNTVVVTITNAAFPLIANMSVEESQERAERDELSTMELPLFILDNTSLEDKVAEWERSKATPFSQYKITRSDPKVQVRLN